jgi:hypothetical protein
VKKDYFLTEEKIKSDVSGYADVESYVSDNSELTIKKHKGRKASITAIKKTKY